MSLPQASQPFRFYTRLSLRELTGLKAVTAHQLLKGLRTVSGSVIYHHTHHYLQQHQFLTPEPPNDFAYWITEVLGEKELGEQLASVDTIEFHTIRQLREALIRTLERYLQHHPLLRFRVAKPEEAIHFEKAISIVLPTPYEARDLKEFSESLEVVTVNSLYYHIFEARLRLERSPNDFSMWFETSLGEKALARAVAFRDPYTHTMEELRQTILRLVRQRLHELRAPSKTSRGRAGLKCEQRKERGGAVS